MRLRRICLIGGTGFVGRHLAARLIKEGYQVTLLTRRREAHRDLLVLPNLQLFECNLFDASALNSVLRGMDAVVNLVGILNERQRGDFQRVHVELPRRILEACRANGIRRLLHMSALKADAANGPSHYLRSKGEGENLVRAADDLQASVFRPSVIFGPEDHFLNRFAHLLASSPGIFPLACAQAQFAPVFVGDVAEAFTQALQKPATIGHAYELCGPKPYTLHALVEYVARITGHRRRIIPLGDRLSWWLGLIMEHLPGKPFSRDNYLSTRVTSLCKASFPEVFDISSTALEAVAPTYLAHRNFYTRFSRWRRWARRN